MRRISDSDVKQAAAKARIQVLGIAAALEDAALDPALTNSRARRYFANTALQDIEAGRAPHPEIENALVVAWSGLGDDILDMIEDGLRKALS